MDLYALLSESWMPYASLPGSQGHSRAPPGPALVEIGQVDHETWHIGAESRREGNGAVR